MAFVGTNMTGISSLIVAGIGLVGVIVGILLNQAFAAGAERRQERLDGYVAILAASAQVIGAQERFFDLIANGTPLPDSIEMQKALLERSDALAAWRIAEARIELAIPRSNLQSDKTVAKAIDLLVWIDHFDRARASATPLVQQYLSLGSGFQFQPHAKDFEKAWTDMLTARRAIAGYAHRLRSRDLMWPFVRRQRQRVDDWYASRPLTSYDDVEERIAASFSREDASP